MHDYKDSYPIHEKCKGCDKVFVFNNDGIETEKCSVYINPNHWWRERTIATKKVAHGATVTEIPAAAEFKCPVATHLKAEEKKAGKKIDPLKASKRRNWR
ncbi:MAG: hypothetical protein PVG39_25025 [Desulfobacteraceae bacterium]|jgi:hypothetical protein